MILTHKFRIYALTAYIMYMLFDELFPNTDVPKLLVIVNINYVYVYKIINIVWLYINCYAFVSFENF